MGIFFFAPSPGARGSGGGNAALSAGPSDFGAASAAPEGTAAATSKPLPVFARNSRRFIESEFEPVAIDNSRRAANPEQKSNPRHYTPSAGWHKWRNAVRKPI